MVFNTSVASLFDTYLNRGLKNDFLNNTSFTIANLAASYPYPPRLGFLFRKNEFCEKSSISFIQQHSPSDYSETSIIFTSQRLSSLFSPNEPSLNINSFFLEYLP